MTSSGRTTARSAASPNSTRRRGGGRMASAINHRWDLAPKEAVRLQRGGQGTRCRRTWGHDATPALEVKTRYVILRAAARYRRVPTPQRQRPMLRSPARRRAPTRRAGSSAVPFAVRRRKLSRWLPIPRLFPAVVSPDGFRVSRPIRRDTTDRPTSLRGAMCERAMRQQDYVDPPHTRPGPQANTGPDAARYGDRGATLRGACAPAHDPRP